MVAFVKKSGPCARYGAGRLRARAFPLEPCAPQPMIAAQRLRTGMRPDYSDSDERRPGSDRSRFDPQGSRRPPGVNELFALLAYGEVAAFYRLTDEARMSPDLRGRINMARMAASEMGHYDLLRSTLEARGVDVLPAMIRYAPAIEQYHRLTTPSTWLEALVKTYVGDALAADLYLTIAGSLPDGWLTWCAPRWQTPGTRSSWSLRSVPR